MVIDCDATRWKAVLTRTEATSGTPGGWRWRLGRTPEASVPFIQLRGPGPLDPEWVAELVGATGGYAAAAEVVGQPDGAPRPAAWVWVAPDTGPSNGHADDGIAAVRVWSRIASVLGSYPATFAWPAADRGQLLSGRSS